MCAMIDHFWRMFTVSLLLYFLKSKQNDKDESICLDDPVKTKEYGLVLAYRMNVTIEPSHDKTKKMACVPSEDSDQPGHPPSLIRASAVRMKKAWLPSYTLSARRRLWSD